MLLSIKSGALICFASVILGAALITARTHYSGKIIKAYSSEYFSLLFLNSMLIAQVR